MKIKDSGKRREFETGAVRDIQEGKGRCDLMPHLKCLRGDNDEPHNLAFIWNLMCCAWTVIHKPEMNDLPKEENNVKIIL